MTEKEPKVKTRRLLWKLAIVLLMTTLAYGKDNPAATASYEKALQQLKSGDLKIDFKALRVNCAASKYECQADPDDIKLLFSLLNNKKFDQALKKVNQVLEKVFVDAELHYIAFQSNSESGNKDKAEFHKGVIRGLLDSIQENLMCWPVDKQRITEWPLGGTPPDARDDWPELCRRQEFPLRFEGSDRRFCIADGPGQGPPQCRKVPLPRLERNVRARPFGVLR
jgi:hypothetical protein